MNLATTVTSFIEFLRSVLKAVSLNAEDTSEGTMPAVFMDSDKDRANLNKPPEYDKIRRLLHSASLSNRDKSGGEAKSSVLYRVAHLLWERFMLT